MILVLLGTQINPFPRLLNAIEECINKKIIEDKVIVQVGHSKVTSNNMEIIDFVTIENFKSLIEQADLIITHGGCGSILNALRANKKVIAVPRLMEFGENINDSQLQIIETFDKSGYIKGIYDISNLADVIKNINDFKPTPFIFDNTKIINIISNFINDN